MAYKLCRFGCILVGIFTCTIARSQEVARLNCQGTIRDVPAVLSGTRVYSPHNAMGDGYVKFSGMVSAGGISGRLTYEGYTQTAPFRGVIVTMQQQFSVGVLDNTGGQMIIYGGGARLGPPDTIGRFVCAWQ